MLCLPLSQGSISPGRIPFVKCRGHGCFVHNMVTYDLKEKMNLTGVSSDPDVDEFEAAGLTKLDSVLVPAKRVAESPVQMECEYVTTIRLPGSTPSCHSDIVIGKVLMIHINEDYVLPDGKLDILKLRPLSRLGYADYTSVTELFEMSYKSMKKDPIPGGMGWMSRNHSKERNQRSLISDFLLSGRSVSSRYLYSQADFHPSQTRRY